MKPIFIEALALKEIENAQSLSRNVERFRARLRAAWVLLMENPGIGSPRGQKGARELILNRLPYSIIYKETEQHLHVVAFAHTRRRPFYWTRRIRGS